ncbi:cytochrome P450 family protein [Micromonospora sp. NBC_01796]|uniref:cytochrome P450 family protein n=1 Tax=Micromonospora sp. NBC_01796 TaxID=2975987 RepID=UPI002DDC84CC|nr:cytochrome P450 [Micromonospora sp. NBC_01796]WSA87493.1 cytochrome P450 [Micromonospora sp. NBC_01796]
MEGRCPYKLDVTGQDVHAEAQALREQGSGIAMVELPGNVRGWVVVGHDLAMELLNSPKVSKNPRMHWPAWISGEIGADWPLASWPTMENMTTAYGQEHQRLRRPVVKAFTPKRVRAMQPYIERTVAGLLDRLAETPPGETVDLKRNFSYPLPATIICDLFGVPEADRAAVLRGGEKTPDSSLTPEEAEANIRDWHEQFGKLIASKRAHPQDDLTTDLLLGDGDDRLTDNELIGTLFVALGAGSETVMNLVTHAVLKLLTHPEQRAMVADGRASWDDVIEETLRLESPLNMLPLRFAVEDLEIDGTIVPKGDPILMGYGAIGRDPAVHGETAEEWDVTRADKEHLSFGYGTHYCFGAPLARLEAKIALPALFERFPDIQLAVTPDDLESQGTFIMNGHKTLDVVLEKAPVPAGAV